MLGDIVRALLTRVAEGEVLWPHLGVFSLQVRKGMPGFPGFTRIQFRPAEELFRILNEGREPPASDTGITDWYPDPDRVRRTADIVRDELYRVSEVTVPELGTFGVSRRKLSKTDEYNWVAFRPDVSLLRSLNAKERNFQAAMNVDYPDGIPESQAPDA